MAYKDSGTSTAGFASRSGRVSPMRWLEELWVNLADQHLIIYDDAAIQIYYLSRQIDASRLPACP